MLKIAILGWGSLVWDPRSLHVRAGWFEDGPMLPIEFARVSDDERVTLVLAADTPVVRSLWALSSLEVLDKAEDDLMLREGIRNRSKIGRWENPSGITAARAPLAGSAAGAASAAGVEAKAEIDRWAKRLGLDAVIWTNLNARTAVSDTTFTKPTEQNIIDHIKHPSLSHERRKNAERYVRMAPPQIDTNYRREMEKAFGWAPFGTTRYPGFVVGGTDTGDEDVMP
jgi:hypothetical protein